MVLNGKWLLRCCMCKADGPAGLWHALIVTSLQAVALSISLRLRWGRGSLHDTIMHSPGTRLLLDDSVTRTAHQRTLHADFAGYFQLTATA